MTKVLEEPVHVAVLKPTHIKQLHKEGKLPKNVVSLEPPEEVHLPRKKTKSKKKFSPLKNFNPVDAQKVRKQAVIRTKLRVLHNNVPKFTEDEQPPCDTCKTAPCCVAFVVALVEQEYSSGLYDPYAVKLTPEILKQVQGRVLIPATVGTPIDFESKDPQYWLEGRVGDPCPLLDSESKCTIYENRPLVCRTYTCVGDDRVTQDMRDGKEVAGYTDEEKLIRIIEKMTR
jgi:Fe-S-cluster containining protein